MKNSLYINQQILGVDIDDFTCGLVSVLNCLRYLTNKEDTGIDYKKLHRGLYCSNNIEAINEINLCVKETFKKLEEIKLPMIVTVYCKEYGRHAVAVVGYDVKKERLLVPNLGIDENMWIDKKKLIEILAPKRNCFVIGFGKNNCDNTEYQC